jgi:predicted metal-dependent hydrolase
LKPESELVREINEALARRDKLQRLRNRIARLLKKWQPRLGVHVQSWQLKDTKGYWATMDETKNEIWFAEDLADMPSTFVEVIVVHELVHYLTNGHDPAFFELMDQHLPSWRDVHATYDQVPTLYSHGIRRKAARS